MTEQHRVTNVDPVAKTGDCAACGPRVAVSLRPTRNYWYCRNKRNQAQRNLRSRKSPDREAKRRYYLKSRFGISPERYDALLAEQGGTCALCGRRDDGDRALAVDHDHQTGRIRGLLCNRCNRALGMFGDDPKRLLRAATYLT